MYDAIIIGGGPAGITAAIYLVRKKLKTLLITEEFGGQAAKSAEMENYPGFKKISGPELLAKFMDQIESLAVESKSGLAVEEIAKKDKTFLIKAGDETFETKTVIIASGKMPRKLEVPGEDEFLGKGVAYCAICDAPLFNGKIVAVAGGGNSALDSAIEIEKYASKIYMLNLNPDFQGDEVRKDHIKESKKIEVIHEAQIMEIFGEQFMKGIKYKDLKSGENKELSCDGIFVEIGWTPSTDFVANLVELNELKEIKIDLENQTSIPGVFAAGDVTDVKEKQVVIAAGEGAKAALNAWQYLIKNRMLS